jgi:ATP-dependent Clp protease ATP-binding subunit ClpC
MEVDYDKEKEEIRILAKTKGAKRKKEEKKEE